MTTGCGGTFVISWSQTETDGLRAASPEHLAVGAAWRWTGEAVRVDGVPGLLHLDAPRGATELRERAARGLRRLIGVAILGKGRPSFPDEAPPDRESNAEHENEEPGFVLTDGRAAYTATIIEVPDTGARLVMFLGGMPPEGRDLWIVRHMQGRAMAPVQAAESGAGVICFAPGTRIRTAGGACLIEDLRPGDRIVTRDSGAEAVLWTGQRRMSGARLHAMPHLRPIRLRGDALGSGRPDQDLLVSPQHRMLLRGAAAQALFNTPEVLVAAEDLVNGRTITVDHSLREVTYVHILLERHQVIWANGLETESFHPSNAALDSIAPDQRSGLLAILPELAGDPLAYGDFARRNLTAAEAAILRHDLAA
ncbi:Hint domain-containing protein [Szabonella alba]|uniref:Hint domain-containing protein n=1 Tax=Szabonella alba TaxID=2804194 RepID=A0A8K0VC06_9RHOB|nr:Hint domain-containing protein [Szabonella alba]MBL4916390.1 Hint domain-containing protein [Szabonella alba]